MCIPNLSIKISLVPCFPLTVLFVMGVAFVSAASSLFDLWFDFCVGNERLLFFILLLKGQKFYLAYFRIVAVCHILLLNLI